MNWFLPLDKVAYPIPFLPFDTVVYVWLAVIIAIVILAVIVNKKGRK